MLREVLGIQEGTGTVQVLAVSDVYEKRKRAAQEMAKGEAFLDYRELLARNDIDAVIIATPDHWHAKMAIEAMNKGKDVYLEKPMTHTVEEAREVADTVEKTKKVLQVGSQTTSSDQWWKARRVIEEGGIGQLIMSQGSYHRNSTEGEWNWPIDPEAGPSGQGENFVDWKMWLGPAPKRPFNPNRFHYNFRWFWDYAGGLMTDWGVHLINMMLMGMNNEPPKTVCSSGGTFVQNDMRETPDSQIALYEFPGYILEWEHKSGMGVGMSGRSWGVSWSGTEGTILLNDEGWELVIEKRKASLEPSKHKSSGDPRPAHVRNFLDCLKSRKQPVLNLELGQHVSTVVHLGNIAFRTGRKITWDAANEKIVGDSEADKLVGVKYRKPWKLPYSKRA